MNRPKLRPGETAHDFTLPAVDDSSISLASLRQTSQAVVVMFLCNHCPYVKAYIPRLIALQREYQGKVAFVAICSNDALTYPDDSFANMKQAARGWAMNFPYCHDADQSVARAYGAERTPEIFLLDPTGTCRYEGGIDDNYQDPARVKERPLRDAIEAVLHNREVTKPQTYAIGCTIKWRK